MVFRFRAATLLLQHACRSSIYSINCFSIYERQLFTHLRNINDISHAGQFSVVEIVYITFDLFTYISFELSLFFNYAFYYCYLTIMLCVYICVYIHVLLLLLLSNISGFTSQLLITVFIAHLLNY